MSAPDQTELELIRRLIPIAELEPYVQDKVAARGAVVEVRRGDVLFRQGDSDRDAVYLLDGEIELREGDEPPTRVNASQSSARRPIAPRLPRRVTARVRTKSKLFRIDRAQLESTISSDSLADGSQVQVSELDPAEDGDWMSRLLGSHLFTRLPPDHIQRFFADLEPVPTSPDDVVVEQGTPGDYLFILADGRCEVVRRASNGAQEIRLAELQAGAVFGEEALINGEPRNATVRMLTAGLLMRLPKASFDELMRKPILRAVPFADAEKLVADGARWLDVRFPEEHWPPVFDGAITIAANLLRLQLHKLERDRHYVVCCVDGTRSSSAAFLLTQNGFDAVYLAGGLRSGSLAPEASGAEPAAAALDRLPPPSDAPPPRSGSPTLTLVPAARVDGAVAAPGESITSPEVQEAELAATRARLETLRARLAEAEQARVAQAGEAARQLEAARAQIESERRRANETLAAARRLQAQAQEARRLVEGERRQRAAVERALAETRDAAKRQETIGRRQLEGALGQARRQLEEVIRAREQTEQWTEEERTRLGARTEAAERRLAQVTAERREAEAAREAAESALGDALRERRTELERQGARNEQAERVLGALRAKVEQAQRVAEAELRRKQELEQVALEADRKLRQEEERLAAERARFEADLEALLARERELKARLEGEEAVLASAAKANAEQSEELARQRGELEAQASRAAADFERQRAELVSGEEALRTAQDVLAETVEQRVAAQRAELEARYEENVARAVKLARRTAEADALGRVTELKSVYERRLSEQAALLEDERRRFGLELERLNEALSKAQRDQPDPAAQRSEQSAGARVLSANQIADIRRRMEEKLREHQVAG